MRRTTICLLSACLVASAAFSPAALGDGRHGKDESAKGQVARDGLVAKVREATRRYEDVDVAVAEGYGPFLGCVSGPDEGAMGQHYANGTLVGDGALDPERPEVLVYAPRRNGRLELAGVEFLVIAEAWDATHEEPPVLEGQTFHYQGSPNRYGLPPFYALHVWAWKDNPRGMFVNWHPQIACENHSAPQS
jgi:hypothetical protein